jgi:hypothetical protein
MILPVCEGGWTKRKGQEGRICTFLLEPTSPGWVGEDRGGGIVFSGPGCLWRERCAAVVDELGGFGVVLAVAQWGIPGPNQGVQATASSVRSAPAACHA